MRSPSVLFIIHVDVKIGNELTTIFKEIHQSPDSTWRYRPPLPAIRRDEGEGGAAFSKLSAAGCFFRRDGQIF